VQYENVTTIILQFIIYRELTVLHASV